MIYEFSYLGSKYFVIQRPLTVLVHTTSHLYRSSNTRKTIPMKLKYIWSFLFFFFISHQWAYSQSVKSIQFKNIRKTDGLSNNMVNGLLRDNLGFLWIATNDGLCRYDGPNKIEVFQVEEGANSLVSSNIRSIYEDSKGNLWIGTRLGGLTKYHRPSETWKTYIHDANDTSSISNDEVLKIMEDSYQRLWVGTENGLNLFDFETETFKRFLTDKNDPYSLRTKAVLDIFEDEKGWIWVGTWDGGLHLLLTDKNGQQALGKFKRIYPSANTATHNVWKIYQDRQKRYWIGTHGGGLFLMQLPLDASNHIDKQDWTPQFHSYAENSLDQESISSSAVQDILQDSKGRLWIATGYGLNCVEKASLPDTAKYTASIPDRPKIKFMNFSFDTKDIHSLADNNVTYILEDEQGLMWFGTANGVSLYSWFSSQFDAYELFNKELKTTNSKNLYVEKNNTVWLGGGQYGLVKYDLDSDQMINVCETKPHLFLDKYVAAIANKNGKWMYVATKLGVTLFNLETYEYRKYPIPKRYKLDIADFYVQTIFVDSKERIWLGTESGLFMVNPNTGVYKRYERDTENPHSISDNSINDILEDNQGNLWVATFNGLNKIAKADIASFKCQRFFYDKEQSDNTILSNQIINLEQVGQKLFYGSTVGLGSYDLITEQFDNYSEKNHKFWIQSLELTEDGHLWGSSVQGLFYFDVKKKAFNIFEKVDGLSDISFLLGSSAQDEDGYIYFGNRGGFTRFHSQQFTTNETPPKVYLTGLKKVSQKGETTINGINLKEIELDHNDYYLAINFAGLNYNRAEKNQYAYKLEGFEDAWNYTEFGIPIVYTNLAPQTYTFRVKAANNDGVWNEDGATLSIVKHPAFWETWWFKLGSFLLLTFGITVGINRYTNGIRKKNLVLKKYNDTLNIEIEERKKVEKALANKEKFSRLIMDNIPQFIYWLDKDCNFLGGNRTFIRYLSLKNNLDLFGRNLADFYIQGKEYDGEMVLLKQVMETEKSVYRRVSLSLPSLQFGQLWVERNFVPLRNDDGMVIGVLISGRDISDTVTKEKLLTDNAEKLREYNDELKRSNQDLEQFAYIASHDLNEPLRMIGNFTGLLARRYKDNLDEDANQYIDFIEDGVSRMSKLINSLLTYSRVGRKEMTYRVINLNKLLEVKLLDLSEMIKERDVIIEKEEMPDIFAEKEQIGMVFYNLINNGIKFNKKEQPKISIKYYDEPNEDYWKFSVRDNGIGIEPEYQHRIFEIFKRLHNKRDFAGTGIGLSVCQKIIFRHSGQIWIESTLGEGTTFYFTVSKLLKNSVSLEQKDKAVGASLS